MDIEAEKQVSSDLAKYLENKGVPRRYLNQIIEDCCRNPSRMFHLCLKTIFNLMFLVTFSTFGVLVILNYFSTSFLFAVIGWVSFIGCVHFIQEYAIPYFLFTRKQYATLQFLVARDYFKKHKTKKVDKKIKYIQALKEEDLDEEFKQ